MKRLLSLIVALLSVAMAQDNRSAADWECLHAPFEVSRGITVDSERCGHKADGQDSYKLLVEAQGTTPFKNEQGIDMVRSTFKFGTDDYASVDRFAGNGPVDPESALVSALDGLKAKSLTRLTHDDPKWQVIDDTRSNYIGQEWLPARQINFYLPKQGGGPGHYIQFEEFFQIIMVVDMRHHLVVILSHHAHQNGQSWFNSLHFDNN